MLKIDETQGGFGTAMRGLETAVDIDLGYLIRVVTRQAILIAAVAAACVALAIVYLVMAPSKYTGSAEMLIDTRRVDLFRQESVLATPTYDTSMVESQIQILGSERLATTVIQRNNLLEDPEFVGEEGGFVSSILSGIFGVAFDPPSQQAKLRKAVTYFSNNLTITRQGLSYVIVINFTSKDPAKAAKIANSTGETYILDQLESKYESTQRASVWLQERIAELRDKASEAEKKVIDFKADNNIVDVGDGKLVNDQQVTEISTAIINARANTAQAKARLDRVDAIMKSGLSEGSVMDALNNEVIVRLRTQYLDASKSEAEWSKRYGPNHAAVSNLRLQMQELQRSIQNELRRIAESYRSDYEISKAREESLQNSLKSAVDQGSNTRQSQVKLKELTSNATTYSTLYDTFLQRYMQAMQQQSFPITEARIITDATPPEKPSSPKSMIILALSLVIGAGLGIFAAFTRDLLDKVIRTSEQLEDASHVECLGLLPRLRRKSTVSPSRNVKGLPMHVSTAHELAVVVEAPFSRFSETIRAIKVAIDIKAISKQTKIIGVVSASAHEGKSTVAANLARLIAQTNMNILLIDADIRNPSLTSNLAPEARSGLIDLLRGHKQLAELTWRDPLTSMEFLPAVSESAVAHTSELLSSPAMKQLLDRAIMKYDYVIVDLPPMLPVVDVRASAHLFDAFVMVAEWGSTSSEAVRKSLLSNAMVADRLIGAVLNKVNLSVYRRFASYKTSSHSEKYYKKYEHID